MKYRVDFPAATLIFFCLGSLLAVSFNDMYPPPLSTTLLGVSEGRHEDLMVSMNIEKIDGRRFKNGLIITLILRNDASEIYSRDLRQPVFDVQIYEASGRLASKWSSCNEMLDVPITIRLEAGGEFTEIKSWEPKVLDPQDGAIKPLPPGRYYLKGTWLGGPIIETGLMLIYIE